MYDFKNIIDYSNELLFNIVHFKHNRNLRAQILINQIYFTAIQALPLVSLIAFFTGVSVVEVGHALVGGTESKWIFEILVAVGIRDVAPVVTSAIILLRSGNAITTELGAMRVEKEIDALISLGISPISYLVTPRVVGMFFSSMLLGIYFAMISVLGGFFIFYLFNGISLNDFMYQLSRVLTVNDLFLLFFKSLFSGAIVGAICTYYGLQKSHMITEIPQKNIKAVTISAISLILFNLAIVFLEILNSDLIGYIKYA